jgi:hypothetical protein
VANVDLRPRGGGGSEWEVPPGVRGGPWAAWAATGRQPTGPLGRAREGSPLSQVTPTVPRVRGSLRGWPPQNSTGQHAAPCATVGGDDFEPRADPARGSAVTKGRGSVGTTPRPVPTDPAAGRVGSSPRTRPPAGSGRPHGPAPTATLRDRAAGSAHHARRARAGDGHQPDGDGGGDATGSTVTTGGWGRSTASPSRLGDARARCGDAPVPPVVTRAPAGPGAAPRRLGTVTSRAGGPVTTAW